jgi:hypothetical protein
LLFFNDLPANGVWIAPRSPHDILAGGQIVSSSENLHGQILRGTAVTRLRRHDDMRVEDADAARDCLRLWRLSSYSRPGVKRTS